MACTMDVTHPNKPRHDGGRSTGRPADADSVPGRAHSASGAQYGKGQVRPAPQAHRDCPCALHRTCCRCRPAAYVLPSKPDSGAGGHSVLETGGDLSTRARDTGTHGPRRASSPPGPTVHPGDSKKESTPTYQ